jgi:hypothetical protein
MFSCWDGKNLDSPDHQSHMYNTITRDGFINAPPCPASHPVRMPQLTYETVWDTTKFNSMWPSGTPNPFVWSFQGSRVRIDSITLFLFSPLYQILFLVFHCSSCRQLAHY